MWTTGPEQQGDEMGMEIPLPPSLPLSPPPPFCVSDFFCRSKLTDFWLWFSSVKRRPVTITAPWSP